MEYEIIKQIGEGTYGKVYKICCKKTKKIYALKEVESEQENGIPFTTIREIKMLKKLNHPNILRLINIISIDNKTKLILDYLSFDLSALIQDNALESALAKNLLYQILLALDYIHSFGFIHRDIKTSNILIDPKGVVKLADFGLTRKAAENMTNRVCTLWYRAPELLLGDSKYTNKIDSFSVGCVFIEMKTGKVAFKGADEIGQTKLVISKLGKPKTEFPWSFLFEAEESKCWLKTVNELFGEYFNGEEFSLVCELLRLEPDERISAKNALKMGIFANYVRKDILIDKEEMHDYYTREKKLKAPVTQIKAEL